MIETKENNSTLCAFLDASSLGSAALASIPSMKTSNALASRWNPEARPGMGERGVGPAPGSPPLLQLEFLLLVRPVALLQRCLLFLPEKKWLISDVQIAHQYMLMRQLLQLCLEEFQVRFDFLQQTWMLRFLNFNQKNNNGNGPWPEGLASAGSGNMRFRGPGSCCETSRRDSSDTMATTGSKGVCVAHICDATRRQDKVKDIKRLRQHSVVRYPVCIIDILCLYYIIYN